MGITLNKRHFIVTGKMIIFVYNYEQGVTAFAVGGSDSNGMSWALLMARHKRKLGLEGCFVFRKGLSLKRRQSFPCFQASLHNAREERGGDVGTLSFKVGESNESGQFHGPSSIVPETNWSSCTNDAMQQPRWTEQNEANCSAEIISVWNCGLYILDICYSNFMAYCLYYTMKS
jgi:hypothetical protein